MDCKYTARVLATESQCTVSPSSGKATLWGRGLTQAIELEIPSSFGIACGITHVGFQILRGDNDFIVYATAYLAINANYNLIVERYVRPTDKMRFLFASDAAGTPAAAVSITDFDFRVLMREE